MTGARRIGLALIVVGLLVNNYGFLHDVIWLKHDGAIFMGLRTYILVVAGAVLTIGGLWLVWRAEKN